MANKYWFRPKSFGYGARPSSIEGWLLSIGYGLVVLALSLGLVATGARQSLAAWIVYLVLVLCLTIVLIFVSKAKTDGEWRWRGGRAARVDEERM